MSEIYLIAGMAHIAACAAAGNQRTVGLLALDENG